MTSTEHNPQHKLHDQHLTNHSTDGFNHQMNEVLPCFTPLYHQRTKQQHNLCLHKSIH